MGAGNDSLESKLRKSPNIVGTPIRLQDGETWIFPAQPLEGEVSDRLTELLIDFAALADRPESTDRDGKIAESKTQNRIVLDIAHTALKLNYPDLVREQLQTRITKQHVLAVVRAVNGMAEIAPLLKAMQGDSEPIRGNG